MNRANNQQKGDEASQVRSSDRLTEMVNHAKVYDVEFVNYLVSILGLKESTARSYDKYVWKVRKTLEVAPEMIVKSDESMKEAEKRLLESDLSLKTQANLMSGMKAYFRYKNGCEYHSACRNKLLMPDVPHELLAQMNDLELKLQEREDALIGRVFQVVLLVLTIGPALVAGSNCPRAVLWGFKCAMFCGVFGLFFLFPVLRRSSRQLKELVAYGKKLRAGEVTCIEFDPSDKTKIGRLFLILAWLCLFGSCIGIFVAIMRIGS